MKKKRIISGLLAFMLALAMAWTGISGEASAAAAMKLSYTKVTMTEGSRLKLRIQNLPAGANVQWSSSNKNRAAVTKNGQIRAKKAGTVTIRSRVSYRQGGRNRTRSFSCQVTIRKAQDTARTLVVYFSVPEISSSNTTLDAVAGASITVSGSRNMGNIQYVASIIRKNRNADSFRIQPAQVYPTDHATLVSQASREQEQNARPQIRNTLKNLDNYDTIFIGYPIWWSDMPQIMYTFFDTYDFSGKTIVPFTVHGGSGLAGTVSRIQRLEPDAEVSADALSISRENAQNSESRVLTWLEGLNLK